MTVVHDLRVDSIVIGERLRPLSAAAVAELVESMTRVGQIQPITIARPNVVPHLVTGHHRLIAARELGWETIACVVLPADTSEDDRLQIEIAENLHRNALTKDERDRHIRLLAEIIERQAQIQVSQNAASEIGYGKPPPQTKGTVAKVAEQVGLSKDTVRRALNPQAEKDKSVSDAADRAEVTAAGKAKGSSPKLCAPERDPVDQFAAWVELTEATADLTADAIFSTCPVAKRPQLSQRCEAVRSIIDRLDELIEHPPRREAAH